MMLVLWMMWRMVRRVLWALRWLLTVALMLLLLRHSTLPINESYYAISRHIQNEHFDYIGWEFGAIAQKVSQAFSREHRTRTEENQVALVRAYFNDVREVRDLEARIEAIYADPNITDPDVHSAELRQQRDTLRGQLQRHQTLVETILEMQVSSVLIDEGFASVGDYLLPPLSMRFIGQTQLLVVSPRDSIEMQHAYTVEPIPVDTREQIEQAILDEQDLSAVIVPIGGMALYPAMVVETPNLSYIVETFAHEWLHHYFMFHPIGWETEFFQNGEARMINETTASLFGREIRDKVLARYYPDLLPPPPPSATNSDENETPQPEPLPPVFDFSAAMHETRITVDELLQSGEIDAAEAYMEERRVLFYDNGYRIRKLNQAWFSFYGGYQVEGIAAGGNDPIGPTVRQLRDESATIYDWVLLMRDVTTRDSLLQLVAGDVDNQISSR